MVSFFFVVRFGIEIVMYGCPCQQKSLLTEMQAFLVQRVVNNCYRLFLNEI